VYEGTLGRSRVCVKRVRVYTRDGPEKTAEACFCCRHFSCLLPLTKLIDLLPRGRDVETLDTFKHRAAAGYYYHFIPAHFELDAWRKLAGVHREALQRRPTSTRKCPSRCAYPMLTPLYQLSDIAKGLCYLHSCGVIHGDLKGVRGSTVSCFTTTLT